MDLIHSMGIIDDSAEEYLQGELLALAANDEEWNLHFGNRTTLSNRIPTTVRPSPAPSAIPSVAPSAQPTSRPTNAPTVSPTVDPYAPVAEPQQPPTWYFNYNPSSAFGPDKW